jgi:membrane dipeptidase
MVQVGSAPAGESYAWFQRELNRIRRHLSQQSLVAVRNGDDVRAALHGTPHVVLSTEGTYFLEGDISRIAEVYRLGIRQIQLAHYIDNGVADFQTQAPLHGGLTELGRQVVGPNATGSGFWLISHTALNGWWARSWRCRRRR